MPKILIDGLPRSGTTTLARLFSIHPDVSVVIEPFHPSRYAGRHHRRLMSSKTLEVSFGQFWQRWSVIKHVWESWHNWPFTDRPDLHTQLWRSADIVVMATRKNLLKRYVSAEICRGLRFWIGQKGEFVDRLNGVCLLPLDIASARQSIERDQEALAFRERFIKSESINSTEVIFETFFGSSLRQQVNFMNELYLVCGLRPLPFEFLMDKAARWLSSMEFQWFSDEIYRLIPNIDEFEAVLSERYGSLFMDQ